MFPGGQKIDEGNVKVQVSVSGCLVPKNLGINGDTWRLGVIVGKQLFIN